MSSVSKKKNENSTSEKERLYCRYKPIVSQISSNNHFFINMSRSHTRRRQNYLVMWVDSNIDLSKEDFKKSLTQLRSVVSEVKICLEPSQCIDALNGLDDGKAFVISSGALGQKLVPEIHEIERVDTIFIFCGNKVRHEQWAKDWTKIEGVYTSINPICESLKKVAHACNHNDIPMSFIPKQAITMIGNSEEKNLNQLPPTYMYSVIFKDIILEIDDDHEKQMNDMIIYCRENEVLESEIIDFKKRYRQKSPIWWYTCEIFLYGMLNQALRSLDMEGMTKMGFFIRHLHRQLEQLHKEQSLNFCEEFTVYRGQGLSQEDFKNLCDIKGGLISFNNFLSTSKDKNVAMNFVECTMAKHKNLMGVLFIMTIASSNISTSTTPFALIDDYSAIPSEQEILFTMHTVFRVMDVKQVTNNNRLWKVQLTITNEDDPDIRILTNSIKNELCGSTGWHRMGHLMFQLGDFNQGEVFYNQLLKSDSSDSDKAFIWHMLGMMKHEQGEYEEAVKLFEASVEIQLKSISADDILLAPTYAYIGAVYRDMGDCSKALEFQIKSLTIREKALPPNHSDLAESYLNIGQVYTNMGEHSQALEFHERAHTIWKEILPSNHPSLAISYAAIGHVYYGKSDYSKALEFYEKDLEISKKALPPDHPNLATSYHNIGKACSGKGDHSKALKYLEKALAIWRKSLPPTHPSIQTGIDSIDSVKQKM